MKYYLKDIAKIKNGKKTILEDVGVKVYGSNGVIGFSKDSNAPRNSIIIGRVGANTGSVFFSDEEHWVTDNAISVVPNNKINPIYLFYLLKQKKLNRLAEGSAQPLVNQKILNSFLIDIPSLEIQNKIADKLYKIDKKIEINNKINTNLLELGLELISNINFKNYLPLNKIVEVKDGTHSSPASTLNGYPLVTSKAIKGTSVDFSQTKNISEADFTEINKRSLVEYHDILISMIGTVGIVHLVTENPVKYAIKNVGLIKSSEKNILSPFLYLYLLSDYGQTYIKEHLSGSTQQFISLTSLRKIPIPISSNIPAKLIEELNAIVLKIEHNSNENNILNSIKNVLLEKYF